MIQGFSFEHGGRTYTCTVERRTVPPVGDWWWFAVSQDQQRYSSFEAASNDTQSSVKARVTAFYENLLEVRARPPELRSHVGRPPGRPKAAPPTEL